MDQRDQLLVQNLINTALVAERNRIADALRLAINQRLTESAVFQRYGDAYQDQATLVREVLETVERTLRNR